MRFHNVTAIQERHFAVCFNPDFVAGMLGDNWEGGDVETKLSRLREFAYIFVRRVLLLNPRKIDVPKQVPKDSSLSLEIEVARFARESRT
jgi:hypothetical protein